ncbi:MAG: CGNR zinc finger domain-containing protein [Ktedonobacteraceae bacterium]
MTTIHEEQIKAAPGPLTLVQALVNTQYGQGRREHVELTNPEQLRVWLVAHQLLADGTPVTEGDFRRVLQLREALRSLLRANNETEMLASQVEVLNRLTSNAPLTVRFHHDGLPTLEPDIAGVDGTLAHLVGIVFTAMTDGTWGRLKACRNDRCQKAFYDTSKNRSGAWCSMARCGSRLKARAYRHRRTAHLEG